MRYLFLSLLLLLAGSFSSLAQENKSYADSAIQAEVEIAPALARPSQQVTDTGVLSAVEQQAVSGFNISEFVGKNFSYPPAVLEDSNFVAVRIMVEFVVEKDASISNIKIKRVTNTARTSLLPNTERLLKQEVIRVISKMPKWQSPAYLSGKPVRSYYNLPMYLKFE